MTNQQPPESEHHSPEFSLTTKIFNIVKQPQTLVIGGVALVAIAIAGYTGTRYVVTLPQPLDAPKS